MAAASTRATAQAPQICAQDRPLLITKSPPDKNRILADCNAQHPTPVVSGQWPAKQKTITNCELEICLKPETGNGYRTSSQWSVTGDH
jgi:hypothetical protein